MKKSNQSQIDPSPTHQSEILTALRESLRELMSPLEEKIQILEAQLAESNRAGTPEEISTQKNDIRSQSDNVANLAGSLEALSTRVEKLSGEMQSLRVQFRTTSKEQKSLSDLHTTLGQVLPMIESIGSELKTLSDLPADSKNPQKKSCD